jgi:hypothetical protein
MHEVRSPRSHDRYSGRSLARGTCGFYALSAFLLFFFMRGMVQETGGRTVEEMAG